MSDTTFQESRRNALKALVALGGLWSSGAVFSQNNSLAQISGGKVALVIGNANYSASPLKNSVRDAYSVASSLRTLGFNVAAYENIALPEMLDAMKALWLNGREAGVRVFYFAGHGLQYHGENYLLPVDAVIKSEDDIPRKAASFTALIDKLKTLSTGVNILVLDACRAPPLRGQATRGLGNGLAHVVAPRGTLVAFSTGPGAVALDGTDANSPYTHSLITHLQTPGLPVEQLFKRVRIDVAQQTKDTQIPWESSSLVGDFCFRTTDGGECPALTYGPR